MAGASVAAKKNWTIGSIVRLQNRRHLAGLSWVNPPIIFAGCQQYSRILHPFADMMVRGVTIEGLELFRIFDRAEFGDIKLPVRIEFDAKHIVNTDVRNDCAGEVRALSKERAHEQSAIAPTLDGQLGGTGVALFDQMSRRSNQIIEHMLFLGKIPRFVPGLTVFAATPKVCNGGDTAGIKPNPPC